MRKNLCLLIYSLGSGGAEKVMSQWSELLQDDFNIYLTIFDPKSDIHYSHGGELVVLDAPADHRNFFTKVLRVLKRAWLLRRFVKKQNIDMVISFCNECNLVNTISPHGAKKLCSIRSASDLQANAFVNITVKSAANHIIVQTPAIRKIMLEQYGKHVASKLMVFGNPFNTQVIRARAEEALPEALRMVMEDEKCIVHVGSFKESKNHAHLLKAFELVSREGVDGRLLLVADSTGLQADIEAMVAKSAFSERILLVGELKNPYPVMKAATVFVLPSLAEGIPNVLAEAMICGAAVIATNCPTGPAELLSETPESILFDDDGLCRTDYGILVEPFAGYGSLDYDNYEKSDYALAKAMLELLGNKERLAEARQCANAGAEKFDIKEYQRELISLVEQEMALS